MEKQLPLATGRLCLADGDGRLVQRVCGCDRAAGRLMQSVALVYVSWEHTYSKYHVSPQHTEVVFPAIPPQKNTRVPEFHLFYQVLEEFSKISMKCGGFTWV